ncbi:MAG: apolipoprotein N-acyltransferase [Desulfovibrionaceae bacterium]|nr:apolipoprotein N-acyltransferase [Desulfovibrionaceae bacterium]
MKTALVPALPAALAAALGLWLGFPGLPCSLPLLVLLHPVGTALLGLGASSGRQAFARGWAAAAVGHSLALYWLYVPMAEVGGLPLAGAVPCALLVCLVLATQAGLFAAICRRFWQPALWTSALAMGLVWYFLEYAYALAAGFPWLPLSGALAPWPWTLQLADTLGATLTSALWAAAALALCAGLLERRVLTALAGCALALAIGLYGAAVLSLHPSEGGTGPDEAPFALPEASADPDVFPVLLVEGNIDQNQKWVESYRTSTVEAYTGLSREAVEAARAQCRNEEEREALAAYLSRGLIMWPETAMPFDLPTSAHTMALMTLARESGMALLTGAPGQEFDREGRRLIYNRVWLMNAAGYPAGSYDKEHLVPFGEYVPAFFRWDFLAGLLQEVGAYTEGTRTAPLRLGRLAMGPLVCYEAVFPWLAQERVEKGANVLVDVSNDGWFKDTAAPWQHLALTGLRALEQNRWLVRCTNTGISAVYDSRGRLVFHGPQFRAEALWASARIETEKSRFHLLFPYLPPVCALLMCGLIWTTSRKSRKNAATE